MDPWPVVKTAKPHNFVKAGEGYYVGNRPYNPTGPAFAGDSGLIKTQCIPRHQKYFYAFGQCTTLDKDFKPPQPKQPWTSWHGKACAGAFFCVACISVTATARSSSARASLRTSGTPAHCPLASSAASQAAWIRNGRTPITTLGIQQMTRRDSTPKPT